MILFAVTSLVNGRAVKSLMCPVHSTLRAPLVSLESRTQGLDSERVWFGAVMLGGGGSLFPQLVWCSESLSEDGRQEFSL